MASLFDIAKQFKENPTLEARQQVANYVSKHLSDGTLEYKEIELLFDILRKLTQDTESKIRKTIANTLQNCSNIPKDIIFTLATDEIDDIATPILKNSPILDEQDLIFIINTTKKAKRLNAITKRENITPAVLDILENKAALPI